MKARVGLLLMGAALMALASFPRPALAEEVSDGTQALAMMEEEDIVDSPIAEHEFYGYVSAGWGVYLERPPSGYGYGPTGVPLTARERESRAMFERFGEVPNGPFLESVNLGYASADGRFVADLLATDIAQNDQNYQLQLSQPGQHYLFFEWDQIPYRASTSAKTLFDTSAPGSLTISDPVQAGLAATFGTPAATAIVNANVRQLEIGTQRDTGKVSYGFTPTPEWDFRVDYAQERKKGRQAFGTTLNGFNSIEIPGPVDYTTQNFGASGQYVGTYGDNKRFNINLAYNGSIFENKYESVTFDNPYRLLPPVGNNNTANSGQVSLAPDNYANRYTLTSGVDLPFDSRFMGTVSFNQMRQDEEFIAKTNNPVLAPVVTPLPADSLNGKIDTLLINNVLTTRLTGDLTSTLRYRYYDVNNRTPELLFDSYVEADGMIRLEDIRSLSAEYTKQNAGADLNWRAQPWLSMGAAYGWERYDRDRRDVDVTDEHSVKAFADVTPLDWVRMRASFLQAYRRYNNYDALALVGTPAYPPVGVDFLQNPLIRKFDLADRDRSKIDASVELMTPIEGLVVTPMVSWRNDDFKDGTSTDEYLGLKQDTVWNAGVEVAYAPSSTVTFMAGYVHEEFKRTLVNQDSFTCGLLVLPAADCNWGSKIDDVINTVYAAANVELIPDSLSLKMGYTFSHSVGKTDTYALGAAGVTSTPQFPDVSTNFHRLDVVLKHKMDPDLVRRLGLVGDVITSLGYTFEHNRMSNWAIDDILPYMIGTDPGSSRSLFLAALNPNYTAHYLGMTVAFQW